jgi:hypothetical protein
VIFHGMGQTLGRSSCRYDNELDLRLAEFSGGRSKDYVAHHCKLAATPQLWEVLVTIENDFAHNYDALTANPLTAAIMGFWILVISDQFPNQFSLITSATGIGNK